MRLGEPSASRMNSMILESAHSFANVALAPAERFGPRRSLSRLLVPAQTLWHLGRIFLTVANYLAPCRAREGTWAQPRKTPEGNHSWNVHSIRQIVQARDFGLAAEELLRAAPVGSALRISLSWLSQRRSLYLGPNRGLRLQQLSVCLSKSQ